MKMVDNYASQNERKFLALEKTCKNVKQFKLHRMIFLDRGIVRKLNVISFCWIFSAASNARASRCIIRTCLVPKCLSGHPETDKKTLE